MQEPGQSGPHPDPSLPHRALRRERAAAHGAQTGNRRIPMIVLLPGIARRGLLRQKAEMREEPMKRLSAAALTLAILVPALLVLAMPAPTRAQTAALAPDDAAQLAQQQQRGRGRPDREAMRAADTIAEAAATYRHVIEMALRGQIAPVQAGVTEAHRMQPRLRPLLDDKANTALDSAGNAMDTALAKEDLTATGLAAAEAFKTVVTSIDPQMRRMPSDVALLHYTALRLAVLVSATEIDWAAVRATAKDAEKAWIGTRRTLRNGNLRVLLSEIQSGLRDAAARNDAAGVKFAATLQIQSIAVLQDFFTRMAQAMGRARR